MSSEVAEMSELVSKLDRLLPCPRQQIGSDAEADVGDGDEDGGNDLAPPAVADGGNVYPLARRDSGFSDEGVNKRRLTAQNSDASSCLGEYDADADADADSDDVAFVAPDDELAARIVSCVESYFSDAAIVRDAFLLKHVRRNREGFVSLKLVASFRGVRHLTRDWRQVAHAVAAASRDLEVNAAGTKVRRRVPLSLPPAETADETAPSRTVVAYDLPTTAGQSLLECVAEMFDRFGDVVQVRILRPGNQVPGDVRKLLGRYPEVGDRVCALIEFEKTEFARKAVAEMGPQPGQAADAGPGVKVLELAQRPKREKAADIKKRAVQRCRSDTYQRELTASEREELEQLRRDRYTSSSVSGSEFDGSVPNLNNGGGGMKQPTKTPLSRRYSNYGGNGSSLSAGSMMRSPGMRQVSSAVAPLYQYPQLQQRDSVENGCTWRSNKPTHQQVHLAPPGLAVAGYHAPLLRSHSDQVHLPPSAIAVPSYHAPLSRSRSGAAAAGLIVPENVLRLPRGPQPNASWGLRST